MQATTDTYKFILRNPGHLKEHRAFVAGVEYGPSDIVTEADTPGSYLKQPPLVTGFLYPDSVPSIGGCVARQLDIMIRPKGDVPRMAEIKLETRLVLRDPLTGANIQVSEWIPKGTFYIDTRETDKVTGVMTIHGYDAMLKAEDVYLDEGDTGEWPRATSTVVADIAARMGVRLDSRTVIIDTFPVPYPNDYTMREILGYIAAAHAGNWIITDAGELRLVGLADIPHEV